MARCWDCQLAMDSPHPSPMAEENLEEEVAYDLRDWPASARVELALTLGERRIPFRWEPGPDLIVAEDVEDAVEKLLDAAEAAADSDDAGDELADEDWDDTGDESEATQASMGDLFVAADRLMHEPWDEDVADDLREATGAIEASKAPFGIGVDTWAKVRALAVVVRDDLDGGVDDDVLTQDARTLREALRPWV